MDDSDKKLLENANSPKSAEVDGQRVEQHPLKEQIELDRYMSGKQALRKGVGIKIAKMVAGGSV